MISNENRGPLRGVLKVVEIHTCLLRHFTEFLEFKHATTTLRGRPKHTCCSFEAGSSSSSRYYCSIHYRQEFVQRPRLLNHPWGRWASRARRPSSHLRSSPPAIAPFSTSPPSEAVPAAACGEERSIPGDWLTEHVGPQTPGRPRLYFL